MFLQLRLVATLAGSDDDDRGVGAVIGLIREGEDPGMVKFTQNTPQAPP